MRHQVPAGPAAAAIDRCFELLIGQVRERLVRPPGVAFVLEERQRVEVHG
jgi:hypothetical protein